MKGKLCCILIIICLSISEAIQNQSHVVDNLLKSLENEDWTADEELCKEVTFHLLEGVKNHSTWATWVWDSMQLPVAVLYGSRYHLGSFDQCLEDPWSQQPMQYCMVDVQLTEETRPNEAVDPNANVEDFIRVESKHSRLRLNSYSLGVCLPKVCTPSSVAKISRHIHKLSHFPFGDVTVDARNCQSKDQTLEYSLGFYLFWFFIFLTTSIVTMVYLIEDSLTNPKLIKISSWFSPSKNFQALTTLNKDEMTSLNGLRAFSAGVAIVLHFYYIATSLPTFTTDIAKDLSSIPGQLAVQLALVVDTFFLMSGLLLMTCLMSSSSNLMKMLCKRYLRLVVPFAVCVLFMSEVLPHAVSGPLWPLLMKDPVDTCTKNWWLSLLMVNNFVRTEEICVFITWYLSCDYQLAVLSTAAFLFCQKWKRQNVIQFCVAIFFVLLAVPAALSFWNRLPVSLIYDIETSSRIDTNVVFQTTYIKPYSRANVYLIGMALGFIMQKYKPSNSVKISKEWSIIGGILGFIIIVSVIGLGGAINTMPYNALFASAYMGLDRSVFAIGICFLILVIEYGQFPLIGDFFTSKVFTPLSRLCYGAYIYQMPLMYSTLYSMRTPFSYNFFHWLINGFGYITVIGIISFLLWFIVEAPATNIINAVFQKRLNISSDSSKVHQKVQ